jgi:hypothetical protein
MFHHMGAVVEDNVNARVFIENLIDEFWIVLTPNKNLDPVRLVRFALRVNVYTYYLTRLLFQL